MKKVLSVLGLPARADGLCLGLGCAGRFPYYLNTYGFQTIHGCAVAVATGSKLARPELLVWVITGDGDGLSAGGNHLLHAMRRNVDIKVILINNEVLGRSKGQIIAHITGRHSDEVEPPGHVRHAVTSPVGGSGSGGDVRGSHG
jgi:2-oxoglutarate ferredoxin oxidoreductase subunit beta